MLSLSNLQSCCHVLQEKIIVCFAYTLHLYTFHFLRQKNKKKMDLLLFLIKKHNNNKTVTTGYNDKQSAISHLCLYYFNPSLFWTCTYCIAIIFQNVKISFMWTYYAFFTVVTNETLYRCCFISVCCQRLNLNSHLARLLYWFHSGMFYVASFHNPFCRSTVIK